MCSVCVCACMWMRVHLCAMSLCFACGVCIGVCVCVRKLLLESMRERSVMGKQKES